jgi:hypothetical protein
VVAKVNSN